MKGKPPQAITPTVKVGKGVSGSILAQFQKGAYTYSTKEVETADGISMPPTSEIVTTATNPNSYLPGSVKKQGLPKKKGRGSGQDIVAQSTANQPIMGLVTSGTSARGGATTMKKGGPKHSEQQSEFTWDTHNQKYTHHSRRTTQNQPTTATTTADQLN